MILSNKHKSNLPLTSLQSFSPKSPNSGCFWDNYIQQSSSRPRLVTGNEQIQEINRQNKQKMIKKLERKLEALQKEYNELVFLTEYQSQQLQSVSDRNIQKQIETIQGENRKLFQELLQSYKAIGGLGMQIKIFKQAKQDSQTKIENK